MTVGMALVQSERFCSPDADLVLLSSDGVRFNVHRKRIEMHSEGFAEANGISNVVLKDSPEIVFLAESSKVLDLLLSIVYRMDRAKANLRNAKFDVLNAVAEAAEKYSFDMASGICEVYMSDSSEEHAVEVMKYAIRHSHFDVMDSAAPWLIGLPFNVALNAFEQPTFLRAWAKYFSACIKRLGVIYGCQPSHTTKYHPGNTCPAQDALHKAVLEAIAIMGTDPACFRNTDKLLSGPLMTVSKCATCHSWFLEWKQKIATAMDSIPKFSTFL